MSLTITSESVLQPKSTLTMRTSSGWISADRLRLATQTHTEALVQHGPARRLASDGRFSLWCVTILETARIQGPTALGVFVPACFEEMARPDWVQKAKHLADTWQVAKHECLLQQNQCCEKPPTLFQAGKESLSYECLAVCSGHCGELLPVTRQVLINVLWSFFWATLAANQPSCEGNFLMF